MIPDHQRFNLRHKILQTEIDGIRRLLRPQAQRVKADDKGSTHEGITRFPAAWLTTDSLIAAEKEIQVIVRYFKEVFDRAFTDAYHVF